MRERLQKIIAARGLASRRSAETWIRDGLVTVNGRVAELGESADPDADAIKVRGKLLHRSPTKLYVLLHKPRDTVSTRVDPEGRPIVADLLKGCRDRKLLYPVGRLDWESEGALLLTNDGELTHKLLHPSSELARAYEVKVARPLTDRDLTRLAQGIRLDDGPTKGVEVVMIPRKSGHAWYRITLREGRNRQVRRMIETLGNQVLRLKRVSFGPVSLGRLAKGSWRELTEDEVEALRYAVAHPGAPEGASGRAATRAKRTRKSSWAKPSAERRPRSRDR
ncbi:MAG: rRNA pseudouridine synthase [Myxococcales bacterium]|nr:rRNA pseudouridine synthase [Myxococcales bacterium]